MHPDKTSPFLYLTTPEKLNTIIGIMKRNGGKIRTINLVEQFSVSRQALRPYMLTLLNLGIVGARLEGRFYTYFLTGKNEYLIAQQQK